MVATIDRSKREVLIQELTAQFPALKNSDLNRNEDSVEKIISNISLMVHQDENEIAKLVEQKLEYICSKSI